MLKRKSNPGYGKAFTFHGSFVSLILARRREREIPGSFIHQHKGRYYVLKPKRIKNPYILTTRDQQYVYSGRGDYSKDHRRAKVFKKASQAVRMREHLEDRGPSDPERLRVRKIKSNPRKKRSCYVIPNPRTGILIYGRVLKIFAQKTSGPYKGERFVHEFKPGALMYGMPDGSLKIIHK